MPISEPNIDPEGLAELRCEIESMRVSPARFMELRGTSLQLLDDLVSAYERLGVLYDRLDVALTGIRPSGSSS